MDTGARYKGLYLIPARLKDAFTNKKRGGDSQAAEGVANGRTVGLSQVARDRTFHHFTRDDDSRQEMDKPLEHQEHPTPAVPQVV